MSEMTVCCPKHPVQRVYPLVAVPPSPHLPSLPPFPSPLLPPPSPPPHALQQVGYAVTTYHQDDTKHTPVIGFDMGGTSTDVSRYDGEYEHVFESTTAGVSIQAPQVGSRYVCVLHLPPFSLPPSLSPSLLPLSSLPLLPPLSPPSLSSPLPLLARHQYSSSWWGLYAHLQVWFVCGGTRICWSQPRTCMLWQR